jgi:hypothetical protein
VVDWANSRGWSCEMEVLRAMRIAVYLFLFIQKISLFVPGIGPGLGDSLLSQPDMILVLQDLILNKQSL